MHELKVEKSRSKVAITEVAKAKNHLLTILTIARGLDENCRKQLQASVNELLDPYSQCTNSITPLTIKRVRRQALNLFEMAIGPGPQWDTIRSRIFDIFGPDGLEKMLDCK